MKKYIIAITLAILTGISMISCSDSPVVKNSSFETLSIDNINGIEVSVVQYKDGSKYIIASQSNKGVSIIKLEE